MPMRQSKYVCFTQTFIPQVYDKLNPILYDAVHWLLISLLAWPRLIC